MSYRDVPVPDLLGRRLREVFSLPTQPRTLGDWADGAFRGHRSPTEADLISETPTRHRVCMGDETLYAYCIIDALMLPLLRSHPAEIVTVDPESGEETYLCITPQGTIEENQDVPRDAVVSFGLARETERSLKCICCPYLNLFRTQAHYERWILAHPDAATVPLSLPAAIGLARAWLADAIA